LGEQKRGNFVFARQDAEVAEDWRKSSDAQNDFDAEEARRQDIKDELKEKGVENVTDDEIVLISDEMARSNKNLMDARIDVARDIEEYQADLLARHAIDPRSDPTADPDASAKFDEWATQFTENQDIDDIIAREEVLIKAARDADELTSEQIKELDAIEAIELEARAYIETIEETTVCVMRS
jgi:predicted transcriptional regulator